MIAEPQQAIDKIINQEYQHGFETAIEADTLPCGLNKDTIRLISQKKKEPAFLLEWRLKAYDHWLTMQEPHWDEVDPELLRTYEKLGIPLKEQEMLAGVAVDAVFDSVSVATTFKAKLAEMGIIFCSFSEAVRDHPDLVKKYLGSVVPYTDNFFASLNSAVFSDGSFVYVPKGVRCP